MSDNIEILNAIKKYNRIVISRHTRPDGDCLGSTYALKRIIQLTWPEKEVYVINSDKSKNLGFLGNEDSQIESYEDTLVIVLDTSTAERISNPRFNEGPCIIKIDHHKDSQKYGDIEWIESYRSSVSEMIASFYNDYSNELKIDSYAATCLYAGICTDSGYFKFSSTSPETLKLAAMLMEKGVDTENLYARLELVDFRILRYQSKVINNVKITPNGVAYYYVTEEVKKEFELSEEEASMGVDFMNSIKGSPIWLLFVQQKGSIRVRLRSRFIILNELAGKYNGGGHANACGSTVYTDAEMKALIDDADALLRQSKNVYPEIE
jgi:phosphoesterase RecJ-like protein